MSDAYFEAKDVMSPYEMKRPTSVAIFGSADIEERSFVYQDAYQAAYLLAKRGLRLVNGGGPGVMEAVTQGAHDGGGKSLAISFQPFNAPYFEGGSETNQADSLVMASDYGERLGLLINNADAFVIFQGGTGTISEWAMVWLLSHIYYGEHKPFVLFGRFWHEVIEVMQRHFYIGHLETKPFQIVESHDEMLAALDRLFDEKRQLQEQLQAEEQRVQP